MKTFYEINEGFQKHITNTYIILLYHGVTKQESFSIENYSKKHIPEKEFYNQIKFVKKHCNLLSIHDVISIRNNCEEFLPKSVVISFDDGYENNYSVAAPILHDLKVPAIFYITSGIVNSHLMFWVDQIEDCINLCKKKRINILLDKPCLMSLHNDKSKIEAVELIKNYCKSVRDEEKNRVIDDLIHKTEISPSVFHSPNYDKITWSQIRELSRDTLFTIGGHSLYHEILSKLGHERMEENIELSIKLLEYNIQEKIEHYSYPEGQKRHYSEAVIQTLKANGITCCPSAIMGQNDLLTDLFHLKRIMVGFNNVPFPFDLLATNANSKNMESCL